MKEQWKQGLQWGSVVWLAWLALSSIFCLADEAKYVLDVAMLVKVIGWTLAFALVWTRGSRLGIALGIAAHVYASFFVDDPPFIERSATVVDGVVQNYVDIEPVLRRFVPACLPLVPLLFMRPERPVYAAALAFVGRWNDAAREVTGLRWIFVAAGVLALHTAAPEALRWWTLDGRSHVVFALGRVVFALAPTALLFGLAALRDPRERVVNAT